jgi:hypothetical protein
MKLADEVKRLFGGAAVTTDAASDEAVFGMIKAAYNKTVEERAAQREPQIWRLIMKSPITKMAVAAAVIVAVGIGLHTTMTGTPAFADVIRPILEAHTATFRLVWHMEDKPAQTMEGKFMDPGLERQTIQAGTEPGQEEQILVMDYVQGKVLALIPGRKTAMIVEMENRFGALNPEKLNQFEELRRRIRQAQANADGTVEYLGEAEVTGRQAVGYRFTEDGADSTIWADAETLLPLQIEHAFRESEVKTGSVVMMDIRFNVPLDPAEFSMEVPGDYTLQTMSFDASAPREADLIETLQIWANGTGGTFPSELDPVPARELGAALNQDKDLNVDDAESFNDPAVRQRMQLVMKTMRGFIFVKGLSTEGIDWHYAGADATLGDATTPVFWYRPAGSPTCRVIYADLSARDVAPEDLPQ